MAKLEYSKLVDERGEQDFMRRIILPQLARTHANHRGIGQLTDRGIADMGGGLGLVINVDGPGTKTRIAAQFGIFDGLGLDIIGANCYDLLRAGARPFWLLTYMSIPTLTEPIKRALLRYYEGLVRGAQLASISIEGGETAQELEGTEVIIEPKGIALGIVGLSPSCSNLLPLLNPNTIEPGDCIIGLLTESLQTNGFRLVRAILDQPHVPSLFTYIDELNCMLGTALVAPTDIFVQAILKCLELRLIKGVANISGGGALNIAVTENYSFLIDNWPAIPRIFTLLQEWGEVSNAEIFKTLNMGVGVVVICSREVVSSVLSVFSNFNHPALVIGRVIDGPGGVVYLPDYHLVGSGEAFKEV